MQKIYFDQNITKELCNNFEFSKIFLKQFKSPPTLIITPRSLIELSGTKIMDCLKNKRTYAIDFSDSLLNQVDKAIDFYHKDSVGGDVISLLERNLKNQKKYVQIQPGKFIFTEYLEYLNSVKGKEETLRSIVFDRVSALPLEQFTSINTYLEIFIVALDFLSNNPHTPIIRLFIKSYKKLPSPSSAEKNKARKMLREYIETADLKENGDLIDTELIQFAIMGYGGQFVHFYTKDNSNKVKKRLVLLYLLLKIFKPYCQNKLKEDVNLLESKKLLENNKLKKIAFLNFKFGRISIIDDTGYITEEIDVQNLLYDEK